MGMGRSSLYSVLCMFTCIVFIIVHLFSIIIIIIISISGDLSQNYDCYVGMATVLLFICISYTCRLSNFHAER